VRALVQRVSSASVVVGDEVVGSIGPGLCAFVGVTHTDDPSAARRLAQRIWTLRIFPDSDGLVSQFTLYADTSKGRRPSFVQAAPPEQAEALVAQVAEELRAGGAKVATGRFRASMRVELVNEGPFTVMLEV
jgi:D-tyrosyl-tRNA(Tyr) deacylase